MKLRDVQTDGKIEIGRSPHDFSGGVLPEIPVERVNLARIVIV